jgi:anti-sigma28 factor (negative regulator of flagellin synthesis)
MAGVQPGCSGVKIYANICLKETAHVTKARFANRRTEGFRAAQPIQDSERSLPLEIREENLRSCREARVDELRRQYLSSTYYVPAGEISAAVIEKHLKR